MTHTKGNAMKKEYKDWIESNVEGNGYGKCAEVTSAMAEAFPELTRVRGHYYCIRWGERAHWWLKTSDGEIVDPTASQFPTKGRGHYQEWDESNEEPTGICPECGKYVYGGKSLCSDECEQSYMRYLETGIL